MAPGLLFLRPCKETETAVITVPQQGLAPPASLNYHRRALSSSSSQFPKEGGEKKRENK